MGKSSAEIHITNNTQNVKQAMNRAVMLALEAVGAQAEGYAKENVAPRVDTKQTVYG